MNGTSVTSCFVSRTGFVLGTFLLVALAVSCGPAETLFEEEDGEETQVVRYGHVPSVSHAETLEKLAPLRERLEERLAIDLRIQFASTYRELVDELRDGEFDFVTLGPLSYVEAAEHDAASVRFKPVRQGEHQYRSIIITHVDSGIETLEHLEGRSFGYVDEGSASGYLFPRAYITQQLDREFTSVVDRLEALGDHGNVVLNVWLRNVDAGAVYVDAREATDNAERIIEETQVVARTPYIPNEPWAVHPEFLKEHAELVDDIETIILELDPQDSGDRPILHSLGVDRFVRAEDGDYDVVREYRDLLPGASIEEFE